MNINVEFLSLTTAINLFEQKKIDEFRKQLEQAKEKGEVEFDLQSKYSDLLIFHIQKGLIDLYGKKKGKNNFTDSPIEKISESVTTKITLLEINPNNSYIFQNQYDYSDIFNPTINYDTLLFYPSRECNFTDISIKHSDLLKLIYLLFERDLDDNINDDFRQSMIVR